MRNVSDLHQVIRTSSSKGAREGALDGSGDVADGARRGGIFFLDVKWIFIVKCPLYISSNARDGVCEIVKR